MTQLWREIPSTGEWWSMEELPDGRFQYIVRQGDCREVMAAMEPASVDAIVTDPPYGLSFMGKEWDHGLPGMAFWVEALRVVKPGAHLVAFGGTRTYHRLTCAIEDAGWEIRDCLMWLYGSGFPKSLDVSKKLDEYADPDQLEGGEALQDVLQFTRWLRSTGITRQQIRETTGTFMDSHYLSLGSQPAIPTREHWESIRPLITVEIPAWAERAAERAANLARREVVGSFVGKDARAADLFRPGDGSYLPKDVDVTAPFTATARRWQGWGTALKPAWEPIILARKPLAGTVAANVLAHGTGALNVDGCRISFSGKADRETRDAKNPGRSDRFGGDVYGESRPQQTASVDAGRWPANVVLSHTPECREVGTRKVKNRGGVPNATSAKESRPAFTSDEATSTVHHFDADGTETVAAFDCAPGCPVRLLDEQSGELTSGALGPECIRKGVSTDMGDRMGERVGFFPDSAGGASRFFYTSKAASAERHYAGKNTHPTVKPVDLMQWLCRLVAPPGGLILDPFCGSGSTGVAALAEGFRFVGIELNGEYVDMARKRIAGPLFAEQTP